MVTRVVDDVESCVYCGEPVELHGTDEIPCSMNPQPSDLSDN